jgi:hypothetical protein
MKIRAAVVSSIGIEPDRSLIEMLRFRLTRLLMWMGAAAAMTYYFDPQLGEKRRKELTKQIDKMRKMGRKARLQADL